MLMGGGDLMLMIDALGVLVVVLCDRGLCEIVG